MSFLLPGVGPAVIDRLALTFEVLHQFLDDSNA